MHFFWNYWYLQSFSRFFASLEETISTLDNTFAVKDTARNMDKPLFQDYTFQGRIIGVVLRVFRIVFGVMAFGIAGMAYIIFYLIWLLFPLICISSLVGSILGSKS